MHGPHTISVVIPCFNEEQGIRDVLGRIPELADETIVVDNASTDRTAGVAAGLGARVVHQPVRGYGAAYKAGFAAARHDIVVTLDGDGSYPPEEIQRLVAMLVERDLEFVSGCRFPLSDPHAMGPANRLGNAVLTFATGLLFRTPIRDSQSGLWVFRRAALERLRLTSDGMAFSQEIKLEALRRGLRFAETHIPYGDRLGTVKLRRWRDGFANLAFLVRRRFE
jgi:hypothetical protein